jgi:hypothetical protein
MSSISQKQLVVFQDLPSDVQAYIALHCDTNSLLRLSGVNRSAYAFLSNERFFKDHFFEQHPRLEPYEKLFTILRSTHPSNCWKVMCQVMDAQWRSNPMKGIAKRVSASFIEEAHPIVVEKLKSQIKEKEEKNKKICGSYFQDSNSPIDRAWKKFKKYEQEFKAADEECQILSQKMREEYALEFKYEQVQMASAQALEIVNSNNNVEGFISSSYEEFMQHTSVETEEISKDQFRLIQKMIKNSFLFDSLYKKACTLRDQQVRFFEVYQHLEAKRRANEVCITITTQKLTDFFSNPQIHLLELTAEWRMVLGLEADLKSLDSLKKCSDLLQKLIEHPEEQTPENCEEICRLINACNTSCKIWGRLYDKCANRIIEDGWAEKHFQRFLPELKEIVTASIEQIILEVRNTQNLDKKNPHHMR